MTERDDAGGAGRERSVDERSRRGRLRPDAPAAVATASVVAAAVQFVAFPPESDAPAVTDVVGEGAVVFVLLVGLFVVDRVGERRIRRPLLAGVAVLYVFALADLLDEFSAQPRWFALVFENGAQALGTVLLVVGLYRWTVARRDREAELRRRSEQLEVLNRILRHDIRNDAMVIRGWASVLRKERGPDADERLGRIVAASNGVIDLTETAREFTDVLTADETVDLEPRPLGATVEAEVQKVRARYEAATVDVDGPLPDVDVVGHSMLPAVFRNLLVNAVEHNDATEPRVRVSADRAGGDVAVRIEDNGPGIPDERKERVFREGATDAAASESGFGLYLVDSLVEQFGGAVRVEDAADGGAAFVVTLRVADGSETDGAAARVDEGASGPSPDRRSGGGGPTAPSRAVDSGER